MGRASPGLVFPRPPQTPLRLYIHEQFKSLME